MNRFRQYLLPSALILALGLGVALAQTITKAIQLSQDATGAFGVDANNNVYFPAHILSTGPGTPALTSCGTTPSITGSDTGGVVTEGTTTSGCAITFAKAYAAVPFCIVAIQAVNATSPLTWVAAATGLNVTHSAEATGPIYNYLCTGSK